MIAKELRPVDIIRVLRSFAKCNVWCQELVLNACHVLLIDDNLTAEMPASQLWLMLCQVQHQGLCRAVGDEVAV